MAAQRRYQIDWAGPHGTAWGTVNACLTTATASWTGHCIEQWWPTTPTVMVLATVGTTVLGMVSVLLRAALRKTPTPAATTLYKLACWAGAGVWAATMVAYPHWGWRWWLTRVAVLVAGAVVAGLVASLATPPADPAPGLASTGRVALAPGDGGKAAQAERERIAALMVRMLDVRCPKPGWSVKNVQLWPRGNGHTVEAIAPEGSSWRDAARVAADIEGDLDLPNAGGITVTQGVTRRAALMEITTVDVLAKDYLYPKNRPAHSINDQLLVGIRDDGEPYGPSLRQNCMVLAGEAGSGKSNAGHVITAEIATTTDALQWDWHLPDGRLWAPWMGPWLRGEVKDPPIDWCAWDARELLWMTRAALRVGWGRNVAYQALIEQDDDDKVPVSPQIPEIVIVGDEVAKVTGTLSEHEEARDNLRLVVFELRSAAVRAVFLALRGTDDVILNGIQSQCQVRGVMRIGSKAEASWVGIRDFGPEDTPYPGCGGLSVRSGAATTRLKYYRMTPSQIKEIVMCTQGRRPKLDEVSRLAANGRGPDGTPMPDLQPGELDCYDTRWDRFRAVFNQTGGTPPATAAPAPDAAPQRPADVAGSTDMGAAVAGLQTAMANLDAARARARAERGGSKEQVDEEFTRILAAEGFGADVDWSDLGAWEQEPQTPAQPSDEDVLLDLIRARGQAGVDPKTLLLALKDRGIRIHRDTLHGRLKSLRERGLVHQPGYGRWAYGAKP